MLVKVKLVYLNGNNAAEGENNMLAVTLILCIEQWRIDLYKTSRAMVTTQMNGVISIRTMLLLSGLKRCYVPDKDSLEQRMNIFHGQLYSLYSQGER